MDLLSSSVTETMIASLNGLSLRHKSLAVNIANAETPNYKRVDVVFNDQLEKIVKNERKKQVLKEEYSAQLMESQYGTMTLDTNLLRLNVLNDSELSITHKDFKPELISNNNISVKSDGNNVQIEYEMAELAKNGMKYDAIAQLLGKKYQGLSDVIKQSGG